MRPRTYQTRIRRAHTTAIVVRLVYRSPMLGSSRINISSQKKKIHTVKYTRSSRTTIDGTPVAHCRPSSIHPLPTGLFETTSFCCRRFAQHHVHPLVHARERNSRRHRRGSGWQMCLRARMSTDRGRLCRRATLCVASLIIDCDDVTYVLLALRW